MQEHELTAWLGDTEATDEQRAQLHRAADMAEARYPDDQGDRETAFTAAAELILGDATLAEHTDAWTRARMAERAAMAALTGAIIAASIDTSENEISTEYGLNRMTVRKALGK